MKPFNLLSLVRLIVFIGISFFLLGCMFIPKESLGFWDSTMVRLAMLTFAIWFSLSSLTMWSSLRAMEISSDEIVELALALGIMVGNAVWLILQYLLFPHYVSVFWVLLILVNLVVGFSNRSFTDKEIRASFLAILFFMIAAIMVLDTAYRLEIVPLKIFTVVFALIFYFSYIGIDEEVEEYGINDPRPYEKVGVLVGGFLTAFGIFYLVHGFTYGRDMTISGIWAASYIISALSLRFLYLRSIKQSLLY